MDSKTENSNWIDISVSLKTGMVHWPGDPPVSIKRIQTIDGQHESNLSELSLGAHSGTHIDAPLHFFKEGKSIHELPLDAVIGPKRIITSRDTESIKVNELEKQRIRKGERILFKTRNSSSCWSTNQFVKDFVYVSAEAAEFLADKKVCTIGIDYLSVGGFHTDGDAIHRILLGVGIWVIEGLYLGEVSDGCYDLICLPLKIFNSDGAPARAVVRQCS